MVQSIDGLGIEIGMMKIENKLTEQDYRDAEKIENNPEMMLRLIDLMFLGYEDGKNYPS